MKKIIIRSLTNRERIKELLLEMIEQHGYAGKRDKLARELNKLYPTEGWSERTISYMLTDAVNIDSPKLNQLLDFLEPDEKTNYKFSSLQQGLDELRLKLSDLESVIVDSRKSGNVIDEKEYQVIQSMAQLFNSKVDKFLFNARKLVGQTLI